MQNAVPDHEIVANHNSRHRSQESGVTTEPTYTTAGNGLSLKSWGINQRGSYRWRALDDGDNIIVPNTGGNGVGLRCASITSGFAGSAIGNISFIER